MTERKVSLEVFGVRSGLLPLLACGTLLAILLRAGGHGIGLTADRTNLFTADLHGIAGLLLLSVCTITGSLRLVTAIDTVFCTGVVRLKLQTAHLTFMLKQEYSPLISVFPLFYQKLGAKSSIIRNLYKSHWGKSKIGVLIAALLQRFRNTENYT